MQRIFDRVTKQYIPDEERDDSLYAGNPRYIAQDETPYTSLAGEPIFVGDAVESDGIRYIVVKRDVILGVNVQTKEFCSLDGLPLMLLGNILDRPTLLRP